MGFHVVTDGSVAKPSIARVSLSRAPAPSSSAGGMAVRAGLEAGGSQGRETLPERAPAALAARLIPLAARLVVSFRPDQALRAGVKVREEKNKACGRGLEPQG